MALGNISGISYVVPDDPGHPDVLPEDTKGIAKSIAARLREWGLRLTTRVDNLTARVDAMAVASGQAPGTPTDGVVAGLILNAASNTRAALNGVIRSLLDPALEALPDVGVLRVEDFGAKHDGVTDDTAAVKAGLAESARLGVPLFFPALDTIRVRGMITLPSGAHIEGRGCTLLWEEGNGSGSWLMYANDSSGCTVRDLTLYTAAPMADLANQRGFSAVGADGLTVHGLSVRCKVGQAGSASTQALGMLFQSCPGLDVARLSVDGFDNGIRFSLCNDFSCEGVAVSRFRLGLWVSDCKRARFRDGRARTYTTTPIDGPGANGVLIDADTPGGTDGLTFEDWVVENSYETAYRIGGQAPVYRVDFIRCTVIRCGNNGFKTLGGTLESGSRHRFIRYTDCTVVDAGFREDTNCAGIAVHLTDDVTITGLVVRSSSSTGYSCREGVYVAGASRVSIDNPSIFRPLTACIRVGAALGDVDTVTVNGGRFATDGSADVFDLDWRYVTMRRIVIAGYPTVEHWGDGFIVRAQANASGEVRESPRVSWATGNASAPTNIATGSGSREIQADVWGLSPADLSSASKLGDGSRWAGGTSGRALGVLKNGSWVWL